MKKFKQVPLYDALFGTLCVVYVGMLLHFCLFRWESSNKYAILFLMLTMMIISLTSMKGKGKGILLKGKWQNVTATIFFFLAVAVGVYFWVEFMDLSYWRQGVPNTLDLVMGGLLIFAAILLCWHTSGRAIPIVVLSFIAYALLGNHLPGFLYHSPISVTRFLATSCTDIEGVLGSLNHIAATWIAIFVFFAGFVQGFGGLDYIMRLIFSLAERFKYALPQTAVISSMLFGCISGSAAANAAGTGSFTIPIMKRHGMPSEDAAAIEAVASSGGQIMPPILGAAAFIMCDYLRKYYYEIMAASFPPALLYFGCVALGVYFLTRKYMSSERKIEIPEEFKQKISLSYLLQGIPILVALIVLLWVFVVYKADILTGGFSIVVSFLAARLVYELILSRGRPSGLWNWIKGIFEGAKRGTMMMVPLGVMLASLGIVIRVLVVSGLASKITFLIVDAFGGNLLLLLIAIMGICILFGMAVTTVAAYILVVSLAAPSLLAVGIAPLQAHFSVFYWAILSGITPPVAAVCVVTTGIAKSDFFKTCWEAMKLGMVLFILPFVFCTQPGLLLFSRETIAPFFICAIGLLGIVVGLQSSSTGLWGAMRRILLIALGGIGIFYTSGLVTWGCLGSVVVLLLLPRLMEKLSAREQIKKQEARNGFKGEN